MEEASGESLQRWMTENLFNPCSMDATYDLAALPESAFLVSSKRLFPPSRKFAFDASKRRQSAIITNSPDPLTHYGLAAGGLFATAKALYSFIKSLTPVEGKILSRETMAHMLSPLTTQSFENYDCGFGMGIFCLTNRRGVQIYGHQGFAYGAVQGAFWRPDSGKIVISLNGGADEARMGRLGRTNMDVINTFLGGGEWI